MTKSVKIEISNDILGMEEAFQTLDNMQAQQIVAKELGKRIVIQYYINEFELFPNTEDFNVQVIFKQFCNKYKITTDEQLERYLNFINQSKEHFLQGLVYDEQLKRLKSVVVTDEIVSEQFIKYKHGQETVLFGIMRAKNLSLARELYYRLRDDKLDFHYLAKEYSIGHESQQWGIMGPVHVSKINPEIRQHLEHLEDGELSEPFTTDGKAYLIVRLIRWYKVQLNDAIKIKLKESMFDEWLYRQMNLLGFNLVED